MRIGTHYGVGWRGGYVRWVIRLESVVQVLQLLDDTSLVVIFAQGIFCYEFVILLDRRRWNWLSI